MRTKKYLVSVFTTLALVGLLPVALNAQTGYFNVEFPDGTEQRLPYNKVNGRAIYQGDIDLGPAPDGSAGSDGLQLYTSVVGTRIKLWPNGVVPYEIDSSISNQNHITAIREAVRYLNTNTFVTLQERNGETYYLKIQSDNPGVCKSGVGYKYHGNTTNISLGSGCYTRGVILHEILHSLGIWHEQSRTDRNNFVNILYENIRWGPKKDDNGNRLTEEKQRKYYWHNFDINKGAINYGPYGYDSIMHYDPTAFGKEVKDDVGNTITILPTIQPRGSVTDLNIGQRTRLSPNDICHINATYYFGNGANKKRVAIKSSHSGLYVRAGTTPDSLLSASSKEVDAWETFNLITLCQDPDDSRKEIVAFESDLSKRIVRSGWTERSLLAAVNPHIMAWERFRIWRLDGNKVAIQSAHSGKFVRAAISYDRYKTILGETREDHVNVWERFEIVPLGN